MDIRYFEFIEGLKRKHDCEISCLRGEMDNHTRPLTDESQVQLLPEAHPHRKGKMTFVVDKFDINQGVVTCSCGAQFDDWATYSHECPRCGVITDID